MDRNELMTLKLQMGIDPSAQIEPTILRAMWRQLRHECNYEQGNHSDHSHSLHLVTTHSTLNAML